MRVIFCASQINGWNYFKEVFPVILARHEAIWAVSGATLNHFRKSHPYPFLDLGTERKEIRSFLTSLSPDLLVMGLCPQVEPYVIEWGREAGIPTIGGVDIGSNIWEKLFLEGRPNFPSRLLAIDAHSAEKIKSLGVSSATIRVVGQPVFDRFIPSKSTSPKGVLFFPSQPIGKYYHNSLGYTEASVLTDLLAVLASRPPSWFRKLQVKIHGEENAGEVLRLLETYNVSFSLEDRVEWESVNLTAGMFSTLLYESYYCQVPTLSYQPRPLDGKLDLADEGKIPLVSQKGELADLLESYRGNTYKPSDYRPDGKSVERIVNEILRFERR